MIFVTNDDGIESPGLTALAQALESIDEVYIVAPDRERSAIGMAITLNHPLRAKQVGDRAWAVDGTPVDCVDLAVSALLPERPKLLVSGVNHGQNLGQDIHFSGTVAAAKKATFLGIPSVAVSLISRTTLPLRDCNFRRLSTRKVDLGKRIDSGDSTKCKRAKLPPFHD